MESVLRTGRNSALPLNHSQAAGCHSPAAIVFKNRHDWRASTVVSFDFRSILKLFPHPVLKLNNSLVAEYKACGHPSLAPWVAEQPKKMCVAENYSLSSCTSSSKFLLLVSGSICRLGYPESPWSLRPCFRISSNSCLKVVIYTLLSSLALSLMPSLLHIRDLSTNTPST